MKRMLFATLLLILAAGSASALERLADDPARFITDQSFLGYVPDRFVIVLEDDVAVDHAKDAAGDVALNSLPEFAKLAGRFGVQRLQPQFPGADRDAKAAGRELARHYKVSISQGDLESAMDAYRALPGVERVEPIGVHTVSATPNDTYYDDPPQTFPYDQWHYWDAYGIGADAAWDSETGSTGVVVGILDTGVKYDHGDLGGTNPPGPNDNDTNGNIFVNTGEVPGNGQDDDGNGYVDDVIGWDFVDRTDWYIYSCVDTDCGGADNDPFDGNGHGTHVAGTVAALTNNGYAVAGIAGGFGSQGVKVVPCRIGYTLSYQGQELGVVIMDYVAESMYYMAGLKQAGHNVAAVNCSFGSSNSGGLAGATDYLIAQDVMVIVAAGNSNSSSADYLGSRTDCLDVGATDQSGNPASFSNYGTWVDIAAPGVSIMSTAMDPANPTADYVAPYDGTSMACPHVVGVAALLESYDPSLTAQDKWDLIVGYTKSYNQSKYVGVGIVDVGAAIAAIGGTQNPPVADFSGTPTSGDYPLTVSFSDLSTNGPTAWSWTFGDGGASTAQSPSHTYTAAGTYTVSLTATNAYGSDTATKVDYITVTEPAPASDTFASGETSVTGTVSGDYTATFAAGGAVETITEETYTGHPRKQYSYLEHRYSFSLPAGSGHTFNLLAARTANNEGDDFVFEYSTDGATWLPLVTVNGSGLTAYSAAVSGAVSGAVTVRVTDTDRTWGNTANDALTVDEMYFRTEGAGPQPPVADFTGAPVSGTEPLTVQFADASTGDPASWSWTFGDGGASTAQNPSHTYNSAGSYTVSLTVANDNGSDTVTKTNYITVTAPGATMHVGDIAVSRSGNKFQTGAAVIAIVDQGGAPVAGATVAATADGPTGGAFSGVTGADGTVTFTTDKAKDPVGEWCFEVTGVSHASYIYDSGANAVTRSCESGDVYGGGVAMKALPREFSVGNHPNPFNPMTTIAFALPRDAHVRVEIFDVRGRRVELLTDRAYGAGEHTLTWNARGQPSGVYFYRVAAGGESFVRKMMLMK